MTIHAQAWSLALLAGLALSACDKAVTGGNANAPGSPGTGNPREVTSPVAADTPPGGSSGMKGLAPVPGSSGGDAVRGTTGSATSAGGAGSQAPGAGTAGGLGGNSGIGMTGSFPAGASSASRQDQVAPGSSNRTPDTAVGRR